MSLQIRRGTDADRQNIVFNVAEIIYTTDTKLVYVGDSVTLGGNLVGSLGGSGNTIYTTDIEPISANDGDGWYAPTTQFFKIYESGAFKEIKVNIADIALNINDGYF